MMGSLCSAVIGRYGIGFEVSSIGSVVVVSSKLVMVVANSSGWRVLDSGEDALMGSVAGLVVVSSVLKVGDGIVVESVGFGGLRKVGLFMTSLGTSFIMSVSWGFGGET